MPFRRKTDREGSNYNIAPSYHQRQFTWHMSDVALEATITGATIIFSFGLFIIWFFKLYFPVSKSDLQTLVQIAAGFGAFSLAVPLFLKDFKVQETLWRSFLILSSIFLISTCVGTIAFLILGNQEIVRLSLMGFVGIVIVVNIRSAMSFTRLRAIYKHREDDPNSSFNYQIYISPTKPLEFLSVILLAVICILISKGLSAPFFILLSYGIIFLLATLTASIISSFKTQKADVITDRSDIKLRSAILTVVENSLSKALNEQEVIDAIRSGPYRGSKELVSRTAVQEAVTFMDSEVKEREPKISIFEYDKVIPRWKDEYEIHIFNIAPLILMFEKSSYHDDLKKDIIPFLKKNKSDNIYKYLSNKSEFSVELLKDANVLNRLLATFDNYWVDKSKQNSKYIIVYNSKVAQLIDTQIQNIILFYNTLDDKLEKVAWCDLHNQNKASFLFEFADQQLFEEHNKLRSYFDSKIKSVDILEMVRGANDWIDEKDILSKFEKSLLSKLYRKLSFYQVAESIIKSIIDSKLNSLMKQGVVSSEKLPYGWPHQYKWKIVLEAGNDKEL